jgi:hypothetical protein
MMHVVLPAAVVLCALVLGQVTSAQTLNDPVARLKACSRLVHQARLECLDKLSQDVSAAEPNAAKPPEGSNWIISETTSPVDYSPQMVATNVSHGSAGDAPSLLSIGCRGGRTELVVATNGSWPVSAGTAELNVAYQINNEPPIEQRWRASATGRSAVFKGDAIRFLQSLGDGGRISIRVYDRQGVAQESSFGLAGLTLVREKMATNCKWPPALEPPVARR